MNQQQTNKSVEPAINKYEEEIVVVPRTALFATEADAWHGMKSDNIDTIINTIKTHQMYVKRGPAETNPTYKQIIPYAIFRYEDKLFVMQRKHTASESRLASKFSLGIGGHMRKEDILESGSILDWAQREFEEEVSYSGNLTHKVIGLLNDDSNEVGQVHFGIVILLTGDSADITIKDEHMSGKLMSVEECKALYPKFEGWSKISFDTIIQ